jgi:DNA-binding transcriptional LysR family regulator
MRYPILSLCPLGSRIRRERALHAAPADVAPSLCQTISDYFARAGGKPVIRLETQLQQTIVSLVAEGLGVALLPQSLQKLGMDDVRFRPIIDPPMVEQVLAWRSANLNPVLPRLLAAAGACEK